MNRARARSDLVNASAHFVAAQRHNDAFDLPPVAKPRHIARIPALFSTNGGLQSGIVAVVLDKLCGVSERRAARDEGRVHATPLAPDLFPDCRQSS